jgi:hypothetical protein
MKTLAVWATGRRITAISHVQKGSKIPPNFADRFGAVREYSAIH